MLRRLLVVQPRVLRLDRRQSVLDGLGEDVGEEVALLRLPALVLELQHCGRKERNKGIANRFGDRVKKAAGLALQLYLYH